MNILTWILVGLIGILGVFVVAGTVVGMIGVIFYKIYRKIRFGISLYD